MSALSHSLSLFPHTHSLLSLALSREHSHFLDIESACVRKGKGESERERAERVSCFTNGAYYVTAILSQKMQFYGTAARATQEQFDWLSTTDKLKTTTMTMTTTGMMTTTTTTSTTTTTPIYVNCYSRFIYFFLRRF